MLPSKYPYIEYDTLQVSGVAKVKICTQNMIKINKVVLEIHRKGEVCENLYGTGLIV